MLCRELDQDGRKRIVEMLWEVVMADGVIHEFEANLVWRAAELLGVSTRDRITLAEGGRKPKRALLTFSLRRSCAVQGPRFTVPPKKDIGTEPCGGY